MGLNCGPRWWSGGGAVAPGDGVGVLQFWHGHTQSQTVGGCGRRPLPALRVSLQEPGSRCHHHLSSRRARLWS